MSGYIDRVRWWVASKIAPPLRPAIIGSEPAGLLPDTPCLMVRRGNCWVQASPMGVAAAWTGTLEALVIRMGDNRE